MTDAKRCAYCLSTDRAEGIAHGRPACTECMVCIPSRSPEHAAATAAIVGGEFCDKPPRDILAWRDECRAADLRNRVVVEPDPLYIEPGTPWIDALVAQTEADIEADIVVRRLAEIAAPGPRCGTCANILTITDRGRRCRECLKGGL